MSRSITTLLNKKQWIIDLFLFVLFATIFGLYSVSLGMDFSFDFRSYHAYNIFSFFNNRDDFDICPLLQCMRYVNPLIDAPQYLLQYFSVNPKISAFILGSFSGILAFLVYTLIYIITCSRKFAFLSTAFGITSSPFLVQVGLSSGENLLSILVISSVIIVLNVHKQKHCFLLCFVAGLISGLATGLKLTQTTYSMSLAGLTFFMCLKEQGQIKNFYWLCFGLICGFLASDGWLMLKLYHEFKNPIFPYFNKLFRSHHFEDHNIKFLWHSPKSLAQWIFFPFYLLTDYGQDSTWRDPRFAVTAICVFYLTIKAVLNKVFLRENQKLYYMLLFVVVSYCIWLHEFYVFRYTVAIAVVSGLFVLSTAKSIIPNRNASILAYIAITIVCCYYTLLPDYGHIKKYNRLELSLPYPIEDDSLVFMCRPSSFLIPYLNNRATYTTAENYDSDALTTFSRFNYFNNRIKTAIEREHFYYIIAPDINDIYDMSPPSLDGLNIYRHSIKNLKYFGLDVDKKSCGKISTFPELNYIICKLYKR